MPNKEIYPGPLGWGLGVWVIFAPLKISIVWYPAVGEATARQQAEAPQKKYEMKTNI
jgi:hypothetical protein